MQGASRWLRILVLIAAGAAVAGCTEAKFAIQAAKNVSRDVESRESGNRNSPDGVPIGPGGIYKVGGPYTINGITYVPRLEPDYDEAGIASWYGSEFHGKPTANGETYDMNDITAAHKTLPLPTYARVTNLENGRSIVVRINDRGPYVQGRIIDLSRRSAQLLGMDRQGTAKVRVRVLNGSGQGFVAERPATAPQERTRMASAKVEDVQAESLPPPEGVKAAPDHIRLAALPAQVSIEPVKTTGIFVQAGAFSQRDNATRVAIRLRSIGDAKLAPLRTRERELFRVRIGPIASVAEADAMLTRVVGAGFPEARIVVD
ncbi:MAG: septal ring lytic transglycosylase RlpA family protein [Alphaproteobacteria bacterium]|nr:septal ring lytic transglycosylase RlpA family protein [Alphaproteobacteria bacterium]